MIQGLLDGASGVKSTEKGRNSLFPLSLVVYKLKGEHAEQPVRHPCGSLFSRDIFMFYFPPSKNIDPKVLHVII